MESPADGRSQERMRKMEDRAWKLYEEEMEGILPCSAQETDALLIRLFAGDQEAKTRLIEGHLERVSRLAEEYREQGVAFSDLVQEGNVALMMAVDAARAMGLEQDENRAAMFLAAMERGIRAAMEELIRQQGESDQAGEDLAVQINVMNEVTRRLAEEYGREATAEEVAAKMGRSVDEVKELMKMALNAVNTAIL